MKRNVNLDEISDGKLYGLNDMVKAGCNGCQGCSDCCRGMGNSVILDPLDIYRLSGALGRTFGELLEHQLELHVVDGLILPNLKMAGPEEACGFLSEEGRCTIHEARPGVCRLFPLGRYYENGGFRYFLQKNECRSGARTKVKVGRWIDTPQLKQNQLYILAWHNLLNRVEVLVAEGDETLAKKLNLLLLNQFFVETYETDQDFYEQFSVRLKKFQAVLDEVAECG